MHRLGQEDQNNFLTDQMSRFWLTSGVRAPGSTEKRHLEALVKRHLEALVDRFLPDPSADARTPRKMASFPHFSPHDRSKKGNAIGKTKHALHSRKAITFGMFNGSLVHRKWQGALRSHFHGVGGHRRCMALQMTLFGAPRPGP